MSPRFTAVSRWTTVGRRFRIAATIPAAWSACNLVCGACNRDCARLARKMPTAWSMEATASAYRFGSAAGFLSTRIEVATVNARARLGAKARTHRALRDVLPASVDNAAVPAHLGLATLSEAGVDVAGCISDSLLHLAPVGLAGNNFVDAIVEHVMDTLDQPEPVPLDNDRLAVLLQDLANALI